MAEYFETKAEAEQFIQEWHSKDGSKPAFFGKIFNHGSEKWIVNYDARQSPGASPHIKVLENATSQVGRIIAATPARVPKPLVTSSVADARYNIMTGDQGTALAVQEHAFNAGDGTAAWITFVDTPPSLSFSTDTLRLQTRITCACNNVFPLNLTFAGARGGKDGKCPSCSTAFGYGFHYTATGYKGGFFLYFCPRPRSPIQQVVIDGIALLGLSDRQAMEAEEARLAEEKRLRANQAQRERSEREAQAAKQNAERAASVAATKQRRQAEGRCPLCGESLGWFAKIRGQRQHPKCAVFRD